MHVSAQAVGDVTKIHCGKVVGNGARFEHDTRTQAQQLLKSNSKKPDNRQHKQTQVRDVQRAQHLTWRIVPPIFPRRSRLPPLLSHSLPPSPPSQPSSPSPHSPPWLPPLLLLSLLLPPPPPPLLPLAPPPHPPAPAPAPPSPRTLPPSLLLQQSHASSRSLPSPPSLQMRNVLQGDNPRHLL